MLALASCHTLQTKLVKLCHKFEIHLVMAKLKYKDLNVKKVHSRDVAICDTHSHVHNTHTESPIDGDIG